ncbi:MAG TPA: tyrosine--tRNA ligase [Acidimicrobiales bacterium]|nr:tyrosine--tRNA ligase [Acidimicrobiales bacterium]
MLSGFSSRPGVVWQCGAVPGLSCDLRFRGLVHQVTDPSIPERLEAGGVTFYYGVDPSAPSLHVGNLLQLCLLRRLQRAGNRPIALLGGGTGLIGDPGGKAGERPLLGEEELAANLEGIRPQLAKFVDLSPSAGASRGLVVDNGAWLRAIPMVQFLRDVGKHFTVNQMVARESVRARLERPDQGISYTEFSYMLLQAYDFLRLHLDYGCTLQVGGSDQWGNIVTGVELVRKECRAEVHGLTTPLVTKADGTKFGKTESGSVWLDPDRTSPYRLYQFFLNVEDAVVGTYLRYFTFLSHDDILSLDEETAARPERRVAQRSLADEVCRLVHGDDETRRARQAAAALFGDAPVSTLDERTLRDVVDDVPSSAVAMASIAAAAAGGTAGGGGGGPLSLVDVLVLSGLASSRSDARRAVAQGAIRVNDRREEEPERLLGPADLLQGRYVVLRKGRRTVHVLRAE